MQQPENFLAVSPVYSHFSALWDRLVSMYCHVKSYFLPNSERERLVRTSQTLYDTVHKLVLCTNEACLIVEQHLNISPPKVLVTDTMRIAEILDSLISTMQEIHTVAEYTEKHVRKTLSRTLYDKRAFSRTSLQEKYDIIRGFQQATMGIFGSIYGPVVCVLLKRGDLPGSLDAAQRQVKDSPVLSLRLQDLLLSSDGIACVFQGEQAAGLHSSWYSPLTSMFCDGDAKVALERAAVHLERATAVLRPLSENVQFIVHEAATYCKLITEAHI